jgi:hypothetical protein
VIPEIWHSYRALPLWVQIWVAFILVPANLAGVAFLDQPGAGLVATLAIGGMIPNALLILAERGFSRAMSLSHLAFWIPLVIYLWLLLGQAGPYSDGYLLYMRVLLWVNLTSLVFDVKDSWQWIRGQRAVAGK